jgi:hypothetical protein
MLPLFGQELYSSSSPHNSHGVSLADTLGGCTYAATSSLEDQDEIDADIVDNDVAPP